MEWSSKREPFRVVLYDEADEMVGEPFGFPALPYPGLRITHDGGIWEVVSVMADAIHPRSMAAREGAPTSVDVRVIPAVGIHD